MASRAVQVLGLGRTTALAVLAGAVVVIVGAGVLTRTRAARNTGDEEGRGRGVTPPAEARAWIHDQVAPTPRPCPTHASGAYSRGGSIKKATRPPASSAHARTAAPACCQPVTATTRAVASPAVMARPLPRNAHCLRAEPGLRISPIAVLITSAAMATTTGISGVAPGFTACLRGSTA